MRWTRLIEGYQDEIVEKTCQLVRIIMGIDEETGARGLKYYFEREKPPLYVPPESPLIKKLQKAYTEVTGRKADLISIGGGTYSRYIDNTVAFGRYFPGKRSLLTRSMNSSVLTT